MKALEIPRLQWLLPGEIVCIGNSLMRVKLSSNSSLWLNDKFTDARGNLSDIYSFKYDATINVYVADSEEEKFVWELSCPV